MQREPLYIARPLRKDSEQPKIERVLIANRGEIACRIIATCRKVGITTVAIYVEEDAKSRHVVEADEALNLGSLNGAAVNPFLDIDLLVKLAVRTKADAIHPGYGYLSENADFVDRVKDAGIIFIGPSSLAMSTLGNKRTSKEFLAKNVPEVPLIPGFAGTSQNLKDLEQAATSIGFPVMLKASAGGGGKGMRIVRDASSLRGELERAQSEAKRSFGSDDCILEKYIQKGKHVEFQVVGDSHGNVISLWDRDCSVQRRHQKIIEEAPCSWLSNDMRARMSHTAKQICQKIGYEGAGTVEFVVDVEEARFYFLEVNARLQVEHPITEEICGIDLVALQLYVATDGNLLELAQCRDIPRLGHAIEARLCAEDAHRDFYPELGTVRYWEPAPGPLGPGRDIRYETAIQSGAEISIFFDPMIAKLIVWAPTRHEAVQKMIKVLANTSCVGVRTNQLFIQSCLKAPEFQDPGYTTSFIGDNLPALLRNPHRQDAQSIYNSIGAAACLFLHTQRVYASGARRSVRSNFRNQRFDRVNRPANIVTTTYEGAAKIDVDESASILTWEGDEKLRSFEVHACSVSALDEIKADQKTASQKVAAKYNAISMAIRKRRCDTMLQVAFEDMAQTHLTSETSVSRNCENWPAVVTSAIIAGARIMAMFVTQKAPAGSDAGVGTKVYAHIPILGTWAEYNIFTPLAYAESLRESEAAASGEASSTIRAPMPCKVLRILKKNGDTVKKDETVMVIESMKMEMSIDMSADGIFRTSCSVGDAVEAGSVLCEAASSKED